MNLLTQLFGGMTQMWLNVAFIVCVFAVLCFKPERVRKPAVFQIACFLFALSIVTPSFSMFLISASGRSGPARLADPLGEFGMAVKVVNFLSPLLFSLAFLMAVGSLGAPEAEPAGTLENQDE